MHARFKAYFGYMHNCYFLRINLLTRIAESTTNPLEYSIDSNFGITIALDDLRLS